ncbi:MAG: hypothetical protein ACRC35_11455 [Angustibacter sp.]
MSAPATRHGAGRVLIAAYAVFGVAATARAAVQITDRFEQAPAAYLLSALAAVVYLVATVALVRGVRAWLLVARVSCTVELLGVVIVGTVSVLEPRWFPDATVWSQYGIGYGFVPVVLPVAGLLFLRRISTTPEPDGR